MSQRSKKEYTEATHLRHKNASRHEKTITLNEFCSMCGYHRKRATRLLRGFKRFRKPKPKKRGTPPVYHNAVWGKGATGVLTQIKDEI